MTRRLVHTAVALAATTFVTASAGAQSLGTLRWQLQPFCNVVTLSVTQQGSLYTLDGYDDQCGAAQRAPLVGLATPNPDGSIGFGMSVVTVPGGRGVQIDARIALATLSGSWSDSAGNAGTFAFGASTGGSARPLPSSPAAVPGAFSLLTDGAFLARGTINVGALPAAGSGTRMMWYPKKSAFRAGTVPGAEWDDVNIGLYSTALGYGTTAGGMFSTALGLNTIASGIHSVATGYLTRSSGADSTALGHLTTAGGPNSTATGKSTTASGTSSTAIGELTVASGVSSTATGYGTIASGHVSTAFGHFTTASAEDSTAMGLRTRASALGSTAMGWESTASGTYSTAMGFRSTASGVSSTAAGILTVAAGLGSTVMGTYAEATSAAVGSFVYGDRSTVGSATMIRSTAPNEFVVRAAGGVGFYTSLSPVIGVELSQNGSGWLNVSDVNVKANFRDLAGDEVLAKIAAMPIREWNYVTQDPSIRHVGPTAQDFRAAFGLGESLRHINTIDADGIALAAVKALEARTTALSDENRVLRDQLAELQREIAALKERR
jgi:hypothetical protein